MGSKPLNWDLPNGIANPPENRPKPEEAKERLPTTIFQGKDWH